MKLKRSVKTKWVKALRSGKFAQTRGELKNETGFCCLGVACEIGITEPRQNGDELASLAFLPDDIQNRIAGFNDGSEVKGRPPRSFKWIAAYIERWL